MKVNYQEKYNYVHKCLSADKYADYNEYTRLVKSLAACFGIAGYKVSGNELAGSYHNQIVGCVDRTKDICEMARSFVSWCRPEGGYRNFTIEAIIKGEIRVYYNDYHKHFSIASLLSMVNDHLKTNKIRRNTKRYRQWIAKNSAKVYAYLQNDAKEALVVYRARRDKFVAKIQAENEEGVEYVCHLNKMIYIISAFEAVTGIEFVAQKASVSAFRDTVLSGLKRRQAALDQYFDLDYDSPEYTDQVIMNSISHDKDLMAFWEHYHLSDEAKTEYDRQNA